ncbi:MAG TPA: hypothetical protein VK858_04275 [Longimicrobiales bacterium]|nr:hypothetical protein [Longimicrobiales bacterium]
MAHIHIPDSVQVRFLPRNRGAGLVFGLMFVVGLVAFIIQAGQDSTAAWASYVSNWLFFSSIAMGAIMFAGATTIVKAKWNWSLRRVSVAFAAFLPVAFVLLIPILIFARENYFPWIEQMAYDPIVQKKAAYLNIPFLITRLLVGVGVLFSIGCYFAYLTVRPDMGRVSDEDLDDGRRNWRDRFMAGWAGQEVEEHRSWERMSTLAPIMALVYALVMSFTVYDLAMSLDSHWFSTLFGGWYFMGAFWGGIAATAFTGMWLRRKDDYVTKAIGLQQRHDIGKLSFAFCVFWTYLFFAQYIVIWYGKLPWEQSYMIARAGEGWGAYSVAVILMCFVFPFAGLLGRAPKMNPRWMQGAALLILFGLWNERYWLVTPSLFEGYDVGRMTHHVLIGIGFLGLFLASVRWFFSTFPVIQVWQPPQMAELMESEVASSEVAR